MTAISIATLPATRAEPKSAPIPAAANAPVADVEDVEAREAAQRAAAFLQAELRRERDRAALLTIVPPILGIALFVGLWALVAMTSPQLPSPARTLQSAIVVFGDP